MDDQELRECIERYYALDGEEGRRAAEELTRETYRPVWAFLRDLTGCPHLADDLTQAAFLDVARTKQTDQGRYQSGGAGVIAWLCGIAHNLARDHWHRGGDVPVGDDSPAMQSLRSREGPADAHLAEREEADLVHAAIRLLPPRQREVVQVDMLGLTHKEIARLGMKLGTVGSTRDRALANLRKLLALAGGPVATT
jgi:RNA polymerase sigma factor (sigma-70 family)